jgi:type IV fimbrial biogenesis protein FimT
MVETLVVLAIAAVLVAMAVPPFVSMRGELALRQASYDLYVSLLLARSEAIKRNARVVVCKSADAERCALTGGWERGWIVFLDANNDALHQPAEALISQQQRKLLKMQITGNGNVRNYVSFTATGTTHLVSHAFQAGTVTACPLQAPDLAARQIVINSTGRMRLSRNILAQCPQTR